MYTIQECYSGGVIHNEWHLDTEDEAIRSGKKAHRDPCFEADYVRVIYEGEMVWESHSER